jgi:hypothetical protein
LSTNWRTAYGGKYTVTLIHGSGVGPELMEHVKSAVRLEIFSLSSFCFDKIIE